MRLNIKYSSTTGITPFSPPIVSSECMNLGLCETVENYPTDLARKLIQEVCKKYTQNDSPATLRIPQPGPIA